MCLLNHVHLSFAEYLIVFSGHVLSNALNSSVLSWFYASSRETSLSIVGDLKLAITIKSSTIILDLSLVVFSILGCLSFWKWRSIDTIQWSNMYPYTLVLVNLTSLCSYVRMRSSVFPNLCVGPFTCCSNPKATIVSLNMLLSALVVFSVLILKSPSIIRLSGSSYPFSYKVSYFINENWICCLLVTAGWRMIYSY